MNIDEGYIKFNIDWEETQFDFNPNDFTELNKCRDNLYKLNLIGAYENGIGFGNISKRVKNNTFVITGSVTGNLKHLSQNHYSLVENYMLTDNYIKCTGLTKASSESLSHAIIYESLEKTNAVIHTHNLKMWQGYLNKVPTTDKNAEFGTPEIAFEIKNLLKSNSGIIVMGGHEEGILTFGTSLVEAQEILLSYYNKFK
jgi:hypothetical protein